MLAVDIVYCTWCIKLPVRKYILRSTFEVIGSRQVQQINFGISRYSSIIVRGVVGVTVPPLAVVPCEYVYGTGCVYHTKAVYYYSLVVHSISESLVN